MPSRLTRSLLSLTAVALLTSLSSSVVCRSNAECEVLPAGLWEMGWDDVVDHCLNPNARLARVALAVEKGRISGTFSGKVLGQKRNACFTGEVISSDTTPVVLLQQREPGYTCVYQFQRLPSGLLRGVWYDTRARCGDVVLHQVDRREL